MKRAIKVVATGRALPTNKLTNEQLEQMVETNDEWIRTRTGIKERYICRNELGENSLTLAIEAAKQAVLQAEKTEAGFTREKIKGVLVATSTPEYHFPSIAALVQKELGLSKEVLSFDLEAACSGFIYGTITAYGLLSMWKEGYVLLIGSEQLTKTVDYTDRSTCILFGDGAGAALVTMDETKEGFVGKAWSDGDTDILSCKENGSIQMKGQEVFRFATKAIVQSMESVMKEAEITMDDVDHVVCHQANARIIEYVQKKYPEYRDRFYRNVEDYGNTSAASIPIALDEMREKGMLQPGQKLMLVGFGAGLTWGSVLIHC